MSREGGGTVEQERARKLQMASYDKEKLGWQGRAGRFARGAGDATSPAGGSGRKAGGLQRLPAGVRQQPGVGTQLARCGALRSVLCERLADEVLGGRGRTHHVQQLRGRGGSTRCSRRLHNMLVYAPNTMCSCPFD